METQISQQELNEKITEHSQRIRAIREGLHKTIIGQEHLLDALLIGLLTDGHILLEGVPGLAKTLAIKGLAQLVEADFSRIQFTPDLLPADVVGTLIYSRTTEEFVAKKGPVFAHFVLADEINRAPAKVQSALLEAMQEHQVTIGEHTYKLPNPFLVLATQNPIEQEGTYTLPEAQADRFMMKVVVDYPNKEEELQIIDLNMGASLPTLSPVTNVSQILATREYLRAVNVDEKVKRYIVDLVFATRAPEKVGLTNMTSMLRYGASPRASISLTLAARAYAFINGRSFVIPEDVRFVAHDVLRHRIGLSYEAEANELTSDHLITQIIDNIDVR